MYLCRQKCRIMEHPRLKFALFGNIYQTKKSASIQKVLAWLSNHDAEIYVDKEYLSSPWVATVRSSRLPAG